MMHTAPTLPSNPRPSSLPFTVGYLIVAAVWLSQLDRLPCPRLVGELLLVAVTAAGLFLLRRFHAANTARLAAASAEAQTRLQRVLRAGAEITVIFAMAADGTPGAVLEANEVACARLGVEREALVGRAILDFLAPEMHDDVRALAGLTAQRPIFGAELLAADGTRLPVSMTAWPLDPGTPATVLLVARDTAESRRAEQALRALRQRLGAVLHEIPAPLLTVAADGTITGWNAEAEHLLGWTAGAALGQTLRAVFGTDAAKLVAWCEEARTELTRVEGVLTYQPEAGAPLALQASVVSRPDADGDGVHVLVLLLDMTDARRLQAERAHGQRALHLLSAAKRTIARATSEQELLHGICQLLVDDGGFACAGIALPTADGQPLTPAATVADDSGCLAALMGAAADTPVQAAMRNGHAAAENDLLGMRERRRWAVEAMNRGFGSLLALPLTIDWRPLGVLTIMARKRGVFTPEEVALLAELADDLTYGLESVRARAEWQRAEGALREAAQQWQATFDAISDPVHVVDTRGHVVRGNRAAASLAGACAAPAEGAPTCLAIHGAAEAPADCLLQRVSETRQTATEVVGLHDRWYQVTVDPLLTATGEYQGAIHVMADITKQQQAEEELRANFARLQSVLGHTITAIAKIVEIRDPYTASHQQRVSDLACAIAREMGMPPAQLEGLRVGGMLHDIGKLYIPGELLSKSGKLTDIEFRLIKGHAEAGYEVLRTIDFPWPVAEMAHQHHERLDGSGYPCGLRGEAILLEARILAVADVVESMASHRPYRPTLGMDRALAEVDARRGTLYDPMVVDACLRLVNERGYTLTP